MKSILFFVVIMFSNLSLAQTCNLGLKYDIQSTDQIVLLCNHGYEVGYNNRKKIPEFVAFLGKDWGKCSIRENNQFIVDNRVVPGSRSLSSNYSNSGYDRGHMVSDEDFCGNNQLRKETYLMSNIVPQLPNFNRGIWNRIDNEIQKIYRQTPSLVIKGIYGEIGAINGVVIPKYFYSIVINQNVKVGYFIPHEQNLGNIVQYKKPVDEILKIVKLKIN
jgi:endonuclease G